MNVRFDSYLLGLTEDLKELSADEIMADHNVYNDRVEKGLNAATLVATKKAHQTRTYLVVYRDNESVEILPEKAETQWLECRKEKV